MRFAHEQAYPYCMANDDEGFQIPVSPIRRRDDSPAKLFGLELGDIVLFVGVFLFGNLIGLSGTGLIMLLGIVYLYVAKIKEKLPERFLSKFVSFQLSRHDYFKASQRDTEWVPPVVPADGRSPMKRLVDILLK